MTFVVKPDTKQEVEMSAFWEVQNCRVNSCREQKFEVVSENIFAAYNHVFSSL